MTAKPDMAIPAYERSGMPKGELAPLLGTVERDELDETARQMAEGVAVARHQLAC
jgi:hypothetical protein